MGSRTARIITLTTDFGDQDHYVAELKGVLLRLAPGVTLVDVAHRIEPRNVVQAAFVLRRIWDWYPRETIHLAIVDPGVGSNRRILLGKYAGQFVIAPDNGLLTFLHRELAEEAVHVVEDRRFFLSEISSTFHGRDVMAPVAAHLANGVAPREFGRATDHIEVLSIPHRAETDGASLIGAVIYVDRFGTLVTNIRADQLHSPRLRERAPEVFVNGRNIGSIRSAYAEVPAGQPLALLGSAGYLEIAVNRGSAAELFGRSRELRVEVR